MALSEQEDFELLALERERALSSSQTPSTGQTEPVSTPSFMDKLGMAFTKAQESAPIGSKMGLMAQSAVQKAFDVGGERLAETLAGPGLKIGQIPGTPLMTGSIAHHGEGAIRTSPEVAAGAGLAAQELPTVAGLAMGLPALEQTAQVGRLGQFGRVVAGPGRKAAGAAMESAEKAVGLNTEIIPTLRKVGLDLGLKSNETTAKTVINKINENLKSGIVSPPQQLLEQHKLISDLLREEPTGFVKMISPKVSKLGSSGVAQASRLDKILVKKLNEAAPGRAEGAANYGAAKTRGNIYKGIGGIAAATTAGANLKSLILHALQSR